jgi:hypothetical protein
MEGLNVEKVQGPGSLNVGVLITPDSRLPKFRGKAANRASS